MSSLEETKERMRAEGYTLVEPNEVHWFAVNGQPLRVEGPATISPAGIINFVRDGTIWTLDPKKFTAVGGHVG